jgi:bifunctional DNA-binding transcriptional regulator/antitoxin component of YhaV-PrlF toxin-antitoxin module
MAYVRLRERNQITLPNAVVERMGLRQGDVIEFSVNSRGVVQLHAAKIVKVGSPEAAQEVREAMKEIDQGKYTLIRNVEELQKHVAKVREELPVDEDQPEPERPERKVNGREYILPTSMAEAAHLSEAQKQDVEKAVQHALERVLARVQEVKGAEL